MDLVSWLATGKRGWACLEEHFRGQLLVSPFAKGLWPLCVLLSLSLGTPPCHTGREWWLKELFPNNKSQQFTQGNVVLVPISHVWHSLWVSSASHPQQREGAELMPAWAVPCEGRRC